MHSAGKFAKDGAKRARSYRQCVTSMYWQMPLDEKNHGSGQISLMVFQTVAKIAIELYGDASSSLVLALLFDFIGKDNDSYLIQHALKALVCDTFNSFNMGIILPIQDFSRMETASDYGNLMYSLRKGTLAFIEERQMLLKMTISNMKGSKMKSNRNEASTIFQMISCGRDDNKSIQCSKDENSMKTIRYFSKSMEQWIVTST